MQIKEMKMEEEKPKEDETTEEPKGEVLLQLERAEKLVEAQKIENDRTEKLMQDKRTLDIMGGKSSAGEQALPEKTEDEKWAEDAKKRYEGTGMDPT